MAPKDPASHRSRRSRGMERSFLAEFPITVGGESPGEQAGGFLEVDGLHQDAFLPVGQMSLASPRWRDEARRRLLKAQRVIDAGKVNRILHAAHHHGLFVVRAAGSAPLRQECALLLTSRVL